MNPALLILLPFGALIAWMLWRTRPEVKPADLLAALKAGSAVLIDVREPAEWAATGTARDAAKLPLSDLRGARRQWTPFLERNQGRPLFVYCQSGSRSAFAAAQLRREGLDARNAGSLAALDRAGWPRCRKRG